MEREPRRSGGALYPEWAKYQQEYKKKHPEKARQWKLNSAKKQLESAGYKVIPPDDQAQRQEV